MRASGSFGSPPLLTVFPHFTGYAFGYDPRQKLGSSIALWGGQEYGSGTVGVVMTINLESSGKSLFWVAIISVALMTVVALGDAKETAKDKHIVRMSELLVSATSIEDGDSLRRAGPPHRIFSVYVKIQNVGRQFPCTNLTAFLVVDPFYEYSAWLLSEGQPSIHELLPTETAEGRYSFDIRDGVIPKELLLKAEDSREARCVQHPDWGSAWHYRSEARIPIEGLPARATAGQAIITPSSGIEDHPQSKNQETLPAGTGQKREIRQQPGSTISMDDNFEYRVVDYGVGQVQIRRALSDDDALSQPIFWMEFRVTNGSQHLLGVPRYSPSEVAALVIADNWGNVYKAWCPLVKSIWSQPTLPIPPRKIGRYKPQESTLDLVVVPLDEFVKDITELRVYLNRYPGDQDWHFFSLRDPMERRRNLFEGQTEPLSTELSLEIGEEAQLPIHLLQ